MSHTLRNVVLALASASALAAASAPAHAQFIYQPQPTPFGSRIGVAQPSLPADGYAPRIMPHLPRGVDPRVSTPGPLIGRIPLEPRPFDPYPTGPGAAPTPPAPAEPHDDHRRYRDRALAAGALGFFAGALVSGAMANQRAEVATNELPGWWIAACAKRYRSYDYATNTYMRKNGLRYWCDPR